MATISELDDKPAPDIDVEVEVDEEANMLNDAWEILNHIKGLDERSEFLTTNRRLKLLGLLDEIEEFLEA